MVSANGVNENILQKMAAASLTKPEANLLVTLSEAALTRRSP
jgi:hypothetical protein